MARTEKVIMTNMCMVFSENRILVQDKTDDDYSGITFPGGHVERGESFIDAVIREVWEETGLKISEPKLCGIKDWMKDEEQNELKRHIEQMVQSEQLLQRDVRKYDEAPEWQLPEAGAFASAKSFRDKVVIPFVNKLKTLIKNLTIQCVRLKEEVIQLRKEKKRLSDDVEFYKGKINDMSDRTELLQEKADDLESVKRYAGAEQIYTIIRKVKEQERTEQQIRRYDKSYGTR